jgi:hypothetical protein
MVPAGDGNCGIGTIRGLTLRGSRAFVLAPFRISVVAAL